MSSPIIDRATGLAVSAALKAPCRAASSTNLTLSGEQTVDGVALVADDRVLVNGQTDASENGIYIVSTGAWQRAPDMSSNGEVATGTLVAVIGGTSNGGVYWVTTTGDIDLGTDDLAFELLEFSALATLAVVGAATIGGTLSVAGAVSLLSTLAVTGTLSVTGAAAFAAAVTIAGTASGFGGLLISTTDAGALGPYMALLHNSANPAANDAIGSYLWFAKSSTGVQRTAAQITARYLDPTNASEDVALDLYGMVNGTLIRMLSVSDATLSQSVVLPLGRLAFPATQNPSSDANVLDDYEEGTTTPTPTAATGSFTTASAVLHYTKVGRRVFCDAKLTVTSLGTAAGAFKIPLPFTNGGLEGHGGGIRTATGVGCTAYMAVADTNINILTAAGATPGATCEVTFHYDIS